MPGALVDRAVEVFETLLLQLEGAHVVFEVAVVDRQPHQVEPQRADERRISLGEEVLQKAVEEQQVQLVADDASDGIALRLLVGRVTGDEVLHVHPAAQAEPTQHHGLPVRVEDLVAPYLEGLRTKRGDHALVVPSAPVIGYMACPPAEAVGQGLPGQSLRDAAALEVQPGDFLRRQLDG